jgi:hypothetical protein
MCDALAQAGFLIHRVNNGDKAYASDQYANRGAEIWFSAARLFEQGAVKGIPNDDILISQLTTRRASVDSKGKLRLESKEEMHRRGLGSPDRADAVFGALACGMLTGEAQTGVVRVSPFDLMDDFDHPFRTQARRGMNAGE